LLVFCQQYGNEAINLDLMMKVCKQNESVIKIIQAVCRVKDGFDNENKG